MKTNRLTIRRFKAEDANDLHEYLSDIEVVRYEPYEPLSLTECIHEAEAREMNECFYAVIHNNKMIGNLYVNQVEPQKIHTYEIGYVFNRKYHGKGFASEAVECLLEDLFIDKKAHRVIAHCNADNMPSWKLLERVGMRREATRVKNMFFRRDTSNNPIWFDSYQYALLNEEYKKS